MTVRQGGPSARQGLLSDKGLKSSAPKMAWLVFQVPANRTSTPLVSRYSNYGKSIAYTYVSIYIHHASLVSMESIKDARQQKKRIQRKGRRRNLAGHALAARYVLVGAVKPEKPVDHFVRIPVVKDSGLNQRKC